MKKPTTTRKCEECGGDMCLDCAYSGTNKILAWWCQKGPHMILAVKKDGEVMTV